MIKVGWRSFHSSNRTVRIHLRGVHAAALAVQDSSFITGLVAADALIVRPPDAPAAEAGAPVPILMLDM